VLVCLVLVSGCGLKFTIKDTPASSFTYAKTDTAPATLTIVDQRKGEDAEFVGGRIGVGGMRAVSSLVTLENMEDPIRYLSVNLEKELVQRGVPIKCSVGKAEGPGLTLYVDQYQIVSFRLTGFSPWECSHVFSGRLVSNGKSNTIKAYFYNGRMPVWSMNEIAEPCFNIPVSIMVKDIASKINKIAFALSAPDSRVQELKAGIDADLAKKDSGETFWRVIDLGSSNNLSAMEPLKKYAQEKDDFLKSCALDAIGMLGPGQEMDFLRRDALSGSYNDRYMAIKAIGDIGTPEALLFIKEMKQNSSYQGEGGFRTVVDLYSR
jgi:hypothetical protein